ncbi:sugar phosphate nucleotidyltransferase, partial [Salmonella enterica]|uniref:sugar phosphate nucleotidyltransferase n=1 Tax=Salmonella enterica TaxID=28901 RepID=UPI003F6845F4
MWPLSRELLPKQFIRLTNDRSLLQNTLRRLQHAPNARPAILVCNETHRFIAAEQVLQAGGGPVEFLLEPS